MQRREFLEAIAGTSGWVAALSLLPLPDRAAFAQGVHARAKASPGLRTLNREQGALVTSIAEALLPRTETVGATDVGVTRFIDLLLTESMLERDRDRFIAGLAAIDVKSQSLRSTRKSSSCCSRSWIVTRHHRSRRRPRPPPSPGSP
ncbi:MAG: gluconate 2-dehydrogenase subunit 3 family protein [Gammaproteobacteria bacterium]|nr:MAG: gluconate 2-dehydrogenase subunit 3 family protein [Gammaproteobacteria bacterium]